MRNVLSQWQLDVERRTQLRRQTTGDGLKLDWFTAFIFIHHVTGKQTGV